MIKIKYDGFEFEVSTPAEAVSLIAALKKSESSATKTPSRSRRPALDLNKVIETHEQAEEKAPHKEIEEAISVLEDVEP